MIIGYLAVEHFETTPEYRAWSKLHHVKEIVSFDTCLCHRIFEYPEFDDSQVFWPVNDCAWVYRNLDWLMDQLKGKRDYQILAVIREPKPETDCTGLLTSDGFRFYGYDLIEDKTEISALTNCGGFDDVFSPNEISEYGLIEDFNRAKEIQIRLREEYPEDDHADCALWAIWRWEPEL